MAVKHILMRAMKTSGGLTSKRGISDNTLACWVLLLPLTVALCNSLEDFTGVVHETSEQYKELRSSRQVKDNHDVSVSCETVKLENNGNRELKTKLRFSIIVYFEHVAYMCFCQNTLIRELNVYSFNCFI